MFGSPCCTTEKMVHNCQLCKQKCCPKQFPLGAVSLNEMENIDGWTILCIVCLRDIAKVAEEVLGEVHGEHAD